MHEVIGRTPSPRINEIGTVGSNKGLPEVPLSVAYHHALAGRLRDGRAHGGAVWRQCCGAGSWTVNRVAYPTDDVFGGAHAHVASSTWAVYLAWSNERPMEHTIYRFLSLLNWARAVQRGPAVLLRRYARIQGYKAVDRLVGQSRRRRRW